MSGKTHDELAQLLRGCPLAGSLWTHYKLKCIYRISGCAIEEARLIPLVMYHRLESPSVTFARPLSEWFETIEHEGKTVQRFICMEGR